ncbi:sugar ABC transporter substrate-binding protein [Ruminococcaceae bacterium OttesenSCG-928-A16]|nr:sugar ABC transporter substrate-binding protein [Ruminococcaceae bacterium OttesenSCG-928-A16]
MKMKKILALALSGLLAASVLAACTPAATPSAPPASTPASAPASTGGAEISGKLTFSVWDLDATGYLQKLVDAFKVEYPEVEVEIIDTPSADYTNKLGVDLNGGAAADVILIKDSDTSYSLAQKGQLEDLTPYVEAEGIDLGMFNGLASNFNFDGKQVGMPFRTDYYVLYYNKDIFDAAGVDYPTNDMTWAEFEEVAKKITTGTGNDKVYGAHFHTWQALVENWGVQDGKNTIMGPDYEFMRAPYEMVLRMQNEDKTIQDFGTLKAGNIHYSGAFQSGNVGMMPMGTWYAATHMQKVDAGETDVTNWGIATIPHAEGTPAGWTVGSVTPIAINAASQNKDAAWAFVNFATTSAAGTAVVADAGQIPGSVNDELRAIITNLEGMPEGAAEAYAVENITLDRPYVEYVNEVNKMLEEEHGLIMIGELDMDGFIEKITQRSAEIQAG